MHRLLPHPATMQLLRAQSAARLARTLSRFRGPRRLALSLLALLLAVVWLGQVAASILFRGPADPRKLAVWIPVGLLAYSFWHLLKAATRTPEEPFEWTPAEQELLHGAPLTRYQLVLYRLMAIAMAAVAKAACFALVMLPDSKIWIAGFVGMLLALLLVDLLRMAIQLVAYGMTRREFNGFRIAVLGCAAVVAGVVLVDAFPEFSFAADDELPASLAIVLKVLNSLIGLRETTVGTWLESPFRLFAGVILAQDLSWTLAREALGSVLLVCSAAGGVVLLDGLVHRRRVAVERRAFARLTMSVANQEAARLAARSMVRVPPRFAGVGSLAWRQALGAFHYRTSLGVAMIVPGVLSCMTLLTPHSGYLMLVQLVGGLVFYSFLLLPTAFKFDFRRDVDRMAVLKELPLSPMAVTLGQLVVPVALCTLFQFLVLLVALVSRPYHPVLLLVTLFLLVPTNVLIFSLENLIFLLYPYRLNQEGLGVFFRSILTFTGKGILFAGALAVALAWALASRTISRQFVADGGVGSVVFVIGLWGLVTAAAAGTTTLLIGVFRRFDPSCDTPTA